MSRYGSGVCPVCLVEHGLRADGKISAHRRKGLRYGSSAPVRVRCGGGGRKPAVQA